MSIQALVGRVGLLGVSFLVATIPTQAQQDLTYDPVQRVYQLNYEGNDGIRRHVTLVPPNHIEPEFRVELGVGTGESWAYHYVLTNRVGVLSEQPLFMLEVDCPSGEAITELYGANGWGGSHGFDSPRETFFCRFVTSDENALIPGSSVEGLTIHSLLLPQVTNARFWGIRPPPPVLESARERPDLAILKAQALGSSGGWYPLRVVAPGRSPDVFRDPDSGLSVVRTDVSQACDLSWITNPGVCNSLRTKLEQASRAIERGNNEAATGQLLAFLNELEAQHGDGPGKHVNDNAYWLLKVNVEFILERIGDGPAVVRR